MSNSDNKERIRALNNVMYDFELTAVESEAG